MLAPGIIYSPPLNWVSVSVNCKLFRNYSCTYFTLCQNLFILILLPPVTAKLQLLNHLNNLIHPCKL